jgi:alpha-ribazole phosphatase
VPNGESFIDLDQRVWKFLDEELEKPNEKPLILVTHSGVIRSVLCRINKIPLQEAFATPLDYGVVVKVEYTR